MRAAILGWEGPSTMVKDSRKIAAILAADVVEYSRLMGADEEGTLAALNMRRALFDELVKEFDGHEFGSVGDSLMAEFQSAVKAVRCALAIQQRMESENASLLPAQRMHLRIGVNLGDVIEEQGSAFGDTVNVAARLQSLARPGGVLISGPVYDQVHLKFPARFIDAGVHQVKNVTEPIACFEVTEPVEASLGHRVAAVLKRRIAITAAAYIFLSLLIVATAKKFAVVAGAPTWTLPALITLLAAGVVPALAIAARSDRRHRPWLLPVVTGIAVIVTVAIWQWWGTAERAQTAPPVPDDKSIAVLPFVDMSEKKDQEYLSDGISEQVLDLLSRIPDLRVIARTSSFSFKGKDVDIATIARKLNVSHVLEGSVRKSGNRVRITTQLIRTTDSSHLWSEMYDRELTDIFAIQDEIAVAVVQQLQATLLGGEQQVRSPSIKPDAYNLYLQGRYLANRRTKADFEKAIGYYQQAVALEPGYAPAWVGLAVAYSAQADNGYVSTQTGYAQSRAANARALELDAGLAEAHLAQAWIHTVYDWDWAAADAELTQALKLAPGNSGVLRHSGRLAWTLGRWDEAIQLFQQATAHDPLSARAYTNLGFACYYSGRLPEAEAAFRHALELVPGFASGQYALGVSLLAQGRPEDSLKAIEQESDATWRRSGLPLALHALGRKSQSDVALAELKDKHGGEMAYQIAQVHAYRGEPDQAFSWLERAYAQRDGGLSDVKGDPLLRNLWADPRYTALLRKLKLPEG